LNLLAAHLFAHVAKLDEANAGALDLEEWDWFRVDEELAELGDLTSTPAHASMARLDVTSPGDAARGGFAGTGVGGYILPRGGR
jgi:hypothetical protein